MNSTPHRTTAALARITASAAFLGGAVALLGCEALLGIEDVSLDPGAGGGGAGASSSSASTSTSTHGGGAADGGGGQGGQAEGDFTFAIQSTGVNVPYNGINHVDVAITRIAGFDGPVEVDVQAPPPGLVAAAITIPPGSSAGRLEVGASGALTLGTAFDLDLIATSGGTARTDSVRAVVTGKPGTLDESFGQAGIAAWNLGSDGGGLDDIRQTAQGKILTAGNGIGGLGGATLKGFRLLGDGAADASFAGGSVADAFCGCTKYQQIRGITRLLNGAVFLVGHASGDTTDDIAFLRYRDDGTRDGVDSANTGKGLIDLGGDESVAAMDLSPSERLLVTGERDGELFVAAINPTYGYLDRDFGAEGWTAPFTGSPSAGTALVADAGGSTLVAGWIEVDGDRDMVLLELTPDGAIGDLEQQRMITRAGHQEPVAMAVQPDGRILVGARSVEAGATDFLVVRFEPDGGLDTTFGEDGYALAGVPGGVAVDMALQRDGRIVVAGNVGEHAASRPTLVRFLPDGALDPTFGDKGVQGLFLGEENAVQSMTVAGDGKLLVAGTRQTFPTYGLVARLWN
ncbi:delta-60 repeat domain-containing protein [Sorangium sp. So ce1014]|uniref:delta-60 repeat domain-containing protein n=1 Tax=Sorangium sp. So ce1014 TaxID=3133326 RepID=UPI003F63F7F3